MIFKVLLYFFFIFILTFNLSLAENRSFHTILDLNIQQHINISSKVFSTEADEREKDPANNDKDLKLDLIQVLFRHGERSPEKTEIYQTDPYEPHTYKKYGYGQLLEVGWQRMYKFGQALRQKYGSFLKRYSDEVYGYSTDYNRTKMSLHAVLSGLFPDIFFDKDSTDWLHYDLKNYSFLTSYFSKPCPKYLQSAMDVVRQNDMKAKLREYEHPLQNLTVITGDMLEKSGNARLDDLLYPFRLYSNIVAGKSLNLSRPDWVTDETFEKLKNLKSTYFDLFSYSETMKRISAGPIIERFLNNMKNDNRINDGRSRKIYLYSGHDMNIAAFTRAHKFKNVPSPPDYGSAFIVEKLFGKNDQIYLRMFYWTGENMVSLKFENDSSIKNEISLDDYKAKVKSLIPQPDDCP